MDFVIQQLDREKIVSSEKNYHLNDNTMDIISFVRFFLNIFTHEEHETLFLTIALIDIFKEISEAQNMSQTIKFVDLTNLICDVSGLSM